MGIAQKINTVPFQIALGISQGIMPLISYNYASGNTRRMKKTFFFTARISLMFLILVMLGYLFFADSLVRMFMQNEGIVAYGTAFLRGMCLAMPFLCMDFLAVGVFQACGLERTRLSLLFCARSCWRSRRCFCSTGFFRCTASRMRSSWRRLF